MAEEQHSWYHGSPHVISVLRKGIIVTHWADLAAAMSLKPAIMVLSDDGRKIRHNGQGRGFLYEIVDPVEEEKDLEPLESPLGEGLEWRTKKPFRVDLVCNTMPRPEDILKPEEIEEFRKREGSE